ncbi:MAG: glycosyltransferase family 2 protein [Spirochaetota bacterium]
MNKDFKLSVVIPIMNEEGNITLLIKKLYEVLKIYSNYEIIFIDDGSTDGTFEVIKKLNSNDANIKYLSFSKNFGHQNALKAGLDYAKGDCVISMDGDLQHPPELIPQLIEKWQEGYDIVYTLRKDDPKTGTIKKITAKIFYKLSNFLSDIKIEHGSADFRLVDRSVVEVIRPLHESPLFFRGIIRWLGFKQYGVEYMPEERFWGKTKYSFRKMFSFAISGITSFSVKPLHFSTKIGTIIAFLSFCYGLFALYIGLFTNKAIEGWTSLLIVISFIGGIQLIMIGIIGEYLGRLFMSQKCRPNYIIKEKSND